MPRGTRFSRPSLPGDGDAIDPGVLVLRPDPAVRDALVRRAAETPSAPFADLLAGYFAAGNASAPGTWLRLPQRFHVRASLARLPAYKSLAPRAAVLHFDGPSRPWDFFRAGPRREKLRWRESFDPAAWWLWRRTLHASRLAAGLVSREEAADWDAVRPRCDALFGLPTPSAGTDPPSWPFPASFVPPSPDSDDAEARAAFLISTFSRPLEEVALLVRHYALHPDAESVYLLWLDNRTQDAARSLPPHWPFHLHPRNGRKQASVHVVPPSRDSFNDRFLPLPSLPRGILVLDDDMLLSHGAVSALLRAWRADGDRLAGYYPRHAVRGKEGGWSYKWTRADLGEGYSMVLTKAMAAPSDLLFLHSCALPFPARAVAERAKNCEDLAANFLLSGAAGRAPLAVWPPDPPGAWRCAPAHAGPMTRDEGDSYLPVLMRAPDGTELRCGPRPAIEDHGGPKGVSGKKSHMEVREGCLAELEGVFGNVLRTGKGMGASGLLVQ
ncbi:glycosyl transferase family 64 domain-containing protein [Hyaloraphidium curvatum]|nr:glycosyl transferase family 64 domain-containing protein [Hyaloraphidium curvatum]